MLNIPIPTINGLSGLSPVASPVASPTSKGSRAAKRLVKTLVPSNFVKSPMNKTPMARSPMVRNLEVPEKPFHERVFEALKKINRTEEEARLILPIIKDFAFFKTFADEDDMAPDAMMYICQNLRYEYHPENTVIFTQGDGSNGKGYLIFSGEVSVVVGSEETLNKVKRKNSPVKEVTPKGGKPLGRGFIKSGTRELSLFNNRSNVPSPKNLSKLSMDHSNEHPTIPQSIPHLVITSEPALEKSNDTFGNRLQVMENNNKRPMLRRRSIRPINNSFRRNSAADSESSHNSSRSRRSSTFEPPTANNVSSGKTFLAISFAGKLNKRRKSRIMDLPTLIAMYGDLANTLGKGAFFGENALTNNTPRGATIITNTPCEFMIMTKDLFDYIRNNFNRNKRKILNFMLQHIPKIDSVTSPKVMENLYYLVEEQVYSVGNYIIKEGDSSEQFFLLFDGECEMQKSIYIDQSNGFKVRLSEISPLVRVGRTIKENIPFTRIQPGIFFGEEALYKKHAKYQFSVQVKTNRCLILMFKRNGFMMRFPRACYTSMKEIFSQKNITHAARIRDLVKIKYPKAQVDENFALDTMEEDDEEENNNNEIIQEKVEVKLKEVDPRAYKDNFRKTMKDTNYIFKFEEKPAETEDKLVLPDTTYDFKLQKLEILPKSTKRLEELKDLFLPLSRSEIYNKHLKNPFLITKTTLGSPGGKIDEVLSEPPSPDKRNPSPKRPISPEKLIKTIPDSPDKILKRPPSQEKSILSRQDSGASIQSTRVQSPRVSSPKNISPIVSTNPPSPLKIQPNNLPVKFSSFKTQKSKSISQISDLKLTLTKIESVDSMISTPQKSPSRFHARTQSLITVTTPKDRHIHIKPVKAPKQEIIRNDGASSKGTWTTFYDTVKKSPTYQYLRPPKTDVYDIESTKLKFQEETENELRMKAARMKNMFNTFNQIKPFYSPRSLTQGTTLMNWMKNLDPPMMNDPAASLQSMRTPENTLTDLNIYSPKNASVYDYSDVASSGLKVHVSKIDTAKETSTLPKLNITQMFKEFGKPKPRSIHNKILQQKHKTMEKLKKKTSFSSIALNSPSSEFSIKPSTSFPITRTSSINEAPDE